MVNEKKVKLKEDFINFLKKKGKGKKSSNPRLPNGQRLVTNFPVLDLGEQPIMDLKIWKLEVFGLLDAPVFLSFDELKKLGVKHYTEDFHCVTTWSKFDVKWSGVSLVDVIKHVKPSHEWQYLIQYGADGYSTNVTRDDVMKHTAFIAFELDGKPIPREHGGIRIIIPHLYAWKGSKFLTKLEFSKKDKPGFWEVRGYHNRGDAFKEERYGVRGIFNKLF